MDNDLISRQAAIAHAISGLTREFEGEKWIRVSEVRESLKTMPSAQSELLPSAERWIPVAERRPEAYGRYLVTLEYEGYRSVMPLYYGRINRIDTFYDSDSEYGDIEYCGAIAWMPLPEPYKGGDEE